MSQWLAMGGYGAYVWASFAITAAGLVSSISPHLRIIPTTDRAV